MLRRSHRVCPLQAPRGRRTQVRMPSLGALGRWVETTRFFEGNPLVRLIPGATAPTVSPPALGKERPVDPDTGIAFRSVMDFSGDAWTDPGALGRTWHELDDVVMGGRSESHVRIIKTAWGRALQLEGFTTTDGGGGFVSARTRNFRPALNLSGYDGLRLRVEGDGQRYKFCIRDNVGWWYSTVFEYAFDTVKDTWVDVSFAFNDMVHIERDNRRAPQRRTLDPAKIFSFQIILSRYDYGREVNPLFGPGEMQISIASIDAWRSVELAKQAPPAQAATPATRLPATRPGKEETIGEFVERMQQREG